jgi:CHAT domain-containing protein
VLTAPANAPDANASFMRASEVMNIRMDADLVILSACNTGGAAGAGGEALSGLARSFFYAGARGLLITHWAVDDGAASLIVADSIRRQGLEGGTSAAALRGAQNLLLDEAGRRLPASFAHPYYWAAFALIGDGKRVSSTVSLRRASIDSLAGRIL